MDTAPKGEDRVLPLHSGGACASHKRHRVDTRPLHLPQVQLVCILQVRRRPACEDGQSAVVEDGRRAHPLGGRGTFRVQLAAVEGVEVDFVDIVEEAVGSRSGGSPPEDQHFVAEGSHADVVHAGLRGVAVEEATGPRLLQEIEGPHVTEDILVVLPPAEDVHGVAVHQCCVPLSLRGKGGEVDPRPLPRGEVQAPEVVEPQGVYANPMVRHTAKNIHLPLVHHCSVPGTWLRFALRGGEHLTPTPREERVLPDVVVALRVTTREHHHCVVVHNSCVAKPWAGGSHFRHLHVLPTNSLREEAPTAGAHHGLVIGWLHFPFHYWWKGGGGPRTLQHVVGHVRGCVKGGHALPPPGSGGWPLLQPCGADEKRGRDLPVAPFPYPTMHSAT
eukprot:Sspe_Gene.59062::Locus_32433_Transcript_1_1_Confidence_1.000_Length_1586::g.59062::m.59062